MTQSRSKGFTIVELLIVIVVIGILAGLVIAAYNGLQQRAQDAQRKSDLTQLKKAIIAARINTDRTLYQINGLPSSTTTMSSCFATSTEPKDRSKTTDPCWTTYYASLDKISAASNIDVSTFKKGDQRGNPYTITEMEGRLGCAYDQLGYFTGNGINTIGVMSIEPYTVACSS